MEIRRIKYDAQGNGFNEAICHVPDDHEDPEYFLHMWYYDHKETPKSELFLVNSPKYPKPKNMPNRVDQIAPKK